MRIFITGGIGSGKSTVSRLLEDRGATVIMADLVGHANLLDPETKAELVEVFGADILDSAGEVIRPALAAKAFVSDEATAALDAITQPRLYAKCLELISAIEEQGQTAVLEMAILDGRDDFYKNADVVICVTAAPEVRAQRLVESRGIDPQDAANRIARQAESDAGRLAIADLVIENDGTIEALENRIDELLKTGAIEL